MYDHPSTAESSPKAGRERFPRRAVVARPFAPRVILKMNVIMWNTHYSDKRGASEGISRDISIDNL